MPKKAELSVVEEKEMIALDASFDNLDTGLEDVTKDDMAIPLLKILQALSPQVNKRDGDYVDGAEAGAILNSVTNTVYDGEEGITVVPCAYRKSYVEWAPRESGQGLIKDHEDRNILDNCFRDEKGKYQLDNGNYIEETAYFYLLIQENGGAVSQAVVPMKGSQLTKARKWVTTMKMQTRVTSDGRRVPAPMFFNKYQLTTVHQQNDMGNWFGWGVMLNGPLSNEDRHVLEEAIAFQKAISSNDVKVQQDEHEHDTPAPTPFEGDDIL